MFCTDIEQTVTNKELMRVNLIDDGGVTDDLVKGVWRKDRKQCITGTYTTQTFILGKFIKIKTFEVNVSLKDCLL